MTDNEQRGFEDLDCYKLALSIVREAYQVAQRLPSEEKYNLADQLRRAAVSITLNIAEGYGRYHYLDSLRFYYIARGSLTEVLSAFITCDTVRLLAGELPDSASYVTMPCVHSTATYDTCAGNVKATRNTVIAPCTKTVQTTRSRLNHRSTTNLLIHQSTNLLLY